MLCLLSHQVAAEFVLRHLRVSCALQQYQYQLLLLCCLEHLQSPVHCASLKNGMYVLVASFRQAVVFTFIVCMEPKLLCISISTWQCCVTINQSRSERTFVAVVKVAGVQSPAVVLWQIVC